MVISSLTLTMYQDDYYELLATGNLSNLDENFVTTMFHLSLFTLIISTFLSVLLWGYAMWKQYSKEEAK